MRRLIPLGACLVACAVTAPAQDTARVAQRGAEFDSQLAYANAAGFRRLGADSGRPARREIRVWIGFGITVPDYFYRLVEDNGHVSGEAYLGWQVIRDGPVATDSLMRYENEGRCDPPIRKGDVEICRLRFARSAPWRQFWTSLDSIGVWSIAEPPPSTGLDGWSIVVETFDGTRYRQWSYWMPSETGAPDSRKAAYIARRTQDFDSLVRPSAHERVVRGLVTTRGDTLEFRECGSDRPWVLEADDRLLRTAAGFKDSTKVLHLSAPLFVEAKVLVEPEFAVRGWWNISQAYAGQLDATAIKSVRQARPSDCR